MATPTAATSPTSLPAPSLPVEPEIAFEEIDDEPVATPTVVDAAPTVPAPFSIPAPDLGDEPSSVCGVRLPVLAETGQLTRTVDPDPVALAELRTAIPESAVPALDRILSNPENVGLVAYRLGEADTGLYLNADVPMPLASVVKIIHLVAYVEAVVDGRLNPSSSVLLSDLEHYYLPGLDLGAHQAALAELDDEQLIIENPPSVTLEQVPWMMIRHSSNAATDYLHMLLGQEAIEDTAISLGLSSQTAPCPFLGQFLIMANHTRGRIDDQDAVLGYLNDPDSYARDAMLLTEAFSRDEDFRAAEIAAHRRPSIQVQRLFSANLNPHGSPREYAQLMARIAQNGLSNGESSFLARRYMEWPMRFPANQPLFTNLGFKSGALPGILTTVYYAYPREDPTPVVVALFFRDLPNRTYQRWRREELAHDELARWLLIDPEAIPLMRAALNNSQ